MSSNKRKQPPYKVCGAFDSFLIEKVLTSSSGGGVGVGCETLVQTTVYYDFSNLIANPAPKIWLFSRQIRKTFLCLRQIGEGGRGAGDWEKRGQEVYGRWEKRGWEVGEKGKKLCKIAQYLAIKKMQRGRNRD